MLPLIQRHNQTPQSAMKYTPAEIESVTPQAHALSCAICQYNGQTGTKNQRINRLTAFGYFKDQTAAVKSMLNYIQERNI